jgi:hypothetical protein
VKVAFSGWGRRHARIGVAALAIVPIGLLASCAEKNPTYRSDYTTPQPGSNPSAARSQTASPPQVTEVPSPTAVPTVTPGASATPSALTTAPAVTGSAVP